MKKILKITAYFISTVIVLGIILAASLYFYYRPTDPKTMTLDAPNGQVIITSDSFGIPHILALKDDNDAYYALGYMHARDRLWQIELQRRATQGTLSEIFGATTLKEDKFLRTLGFYRAAQTEWLSFSPHCKRW